MDLKRAGIDRAGVSLHSLRYSFVSHLILAGVSPKVVQQLAGHKSFQVTMDIYAQVLPWHERDAVEKLPLGPAVVPAIQTASEAVAG